MPRKYRLETLTPRQLSRLRQDIVLCSLYYKDYVNRYNIDEHLVCNFFDGYAEYIGELMEEDGIDGNSYFDKLNIYDTIANLLSWQDIYAGGVE